MPIDFPANPTNGQVFSNWIYDSSITAWRNVNTDTGVAALNTMGLRNVVPSSVVVGSGSATVNANGQVSFTAASSISLNGVFTSTYNHYRIIYTLGVGSSTNGELRIRYRASNSDNSSTTYFQVVQCLSINGTANTFSGTSLSYGALSETATTAIGTNFYGGGLDVRNPQAPLTTTSQWQSFGFRPGTGEATWQGGNHFNATTQFDGFSIYLSAAGTMTGNVTVYGYTN
jgi:hypothetical protein